MITRFFIILLILTTSCSSTHLIQPSFADLSKASEKIPGITLAELQQGYKLYSVKCSACHRLHDPAEYTNQKWEPILLKMFVKAKISEEEQKMLIHNYIIAKCK